MKAMAQNYIFDAGNKKITINDISSFKLEDILLITNVTRNIIIYSFADILLGGSIVNGNQILLTYDTTSMNSSDSLQIYIDINIAKYEGEQYPIIEQFTYDTNMNNVLGSQPLVEDNKIKTKVSMATLAEAKGRIGSSNEEMSLDCAGSQTVTLQLYGTWAGTISFECRANDGVYQGIIGALTSSFSFATSTTSGGIWQFNVAGLKRFRIRFSTYTSGTAIVQMSASSAQSRLANIDGVYGSQSTLLNQRASTFELNTYDTNLATILGNTKMWRDGMFTYDYPLAPTVALSQPASYTDNKFAKTPQVLPRLRVEIGGDQRLPLAQDANTNKLLVADDINRRLLEEILVQMQLLNQNFSQSNNTQLPTGQQEIK